VSRARRAQEPRRLGAVSGSVHAAVAGRGRGRGGVGQESPRSTAFGPLVRSLPVANDERSEARSPVPVIPPAPTCHDAPVLRSASERPPRSTGGDSPGVPDRPCRARRSRGRRGQQEDERFAPGVDDERAVGDRDGYRACVRVAPVADVRRRRVRAQPRHVLDELGVGRGPIDPADGVVLAVGVVVAAPRAVELVPAEQQRHALGE
jgi:hypothetical protein